MPLFTAKLKRRVYITEVTSVQFEAASITEAWKTRALEVSESSETKWEEDDVSNSTTLHPEVVSIEILAEGNEKIDE